MLPAQLKPEHFTGYPPEAKELVRNHLQTLRQLPLSFLPLFLREAIAYDWKFPAERKELDTQLAYMAGLNAEQLQELMAPFARLRLSPEMERIDWVNEPREFSEQLTAYLWATHQIDAFREAALQFGQKTEAAKQAETASIARLGIAVIGRGAAENHYPLFRKLRRHGVYFSNVQASDGLRAVVEKTALRAEAHPIPFGHWYIEGAAAEEVPSSRITYVSYSSLGPIQEAVVATMRRAVETGTGPEALRTRLAQLGPQDVGMRDSTKEAAVLNRFKLSMLTEGSGTQLFSTTFVQWTAREALRRAQPVTLLVRFAPRQRERPMNELLARTEFKPELDPQGSLIDADMGAYYTWINLQRLPAADRSAFLVWFEDHNEAVAVGPTMPRGTESSSRISMRQLLEMLL